MPEIIYDTDQSRLFPENVAEIIKLIEEDSIKMHAVTEGLNKLDTMYRKSLQKYLIARQQSRDLQKVVDNLTKVNNEYESKFDTLMSRVYFLEANTRDSEKETKKEGERLTRNAKMWKAVGIGGLSSLGAVVAYIGIKELITRIF